MFEIDMWLLFYIYKLSLMYSRMFQKVIEIAWQNWLKVTLSINVFANHNWNILKNIGFSVKIKLTQPSAEIIRKKSEDKCIVYIPTYVRNDGRTFYVSALTYDSRSKSKFLCLI